MLVEHFVGNMDNGADFGGRLDWDKPAPWEWTSHSSDWSAGGGDEPVTVCNPPPRNSSACTEVRTPVVVAFTPPAVKHEDEDADLIATRTKKKAEKMINDCGIPAAQNSSGQKDFFLGLGGASAGKSEMGSKEQGGKQVNQDAETGLQLELKRSFTPPEATPSPNKGSPCKKPRGSANHTPRCQVEGCKTDLSSAKDYHRRHKVCAMHSKSAKVSVNSIEQRFCQQCSRFHVLSEFDEGKRSCRRRLAGHNERRRKPQPDPMALTTAALSPYHAGFMRLAREERLLYGTPISYLGDNLHGKLSWPRFEDHTGLSAGTNSLSRPERVFMLFPPRKVPPILTSGVHQFMQGSGSIMGQNLSLSSSSGTGVYTGLGPPTNSTTATTTISDSGRALSLLSSQSWATDSSSSIEQLMSENRGYKAGFGSQQQASLSGGVQSQGTAYLPGPNTTMSVSAYENQHHPSVLTLLQEQQRPTMDLMQSAPTVVQQPQDFQVLKPYGSTAMYDPHQI